MNKTEINEWIENATCIESRSSENNDGNIYEVRIFELNGEIFVLDFCNDCPNEVRGKHGYVRGEYQPKKVITTERTELVTYTDYVDEKGKVIASIEEINRN